MSQYLTTKELAELLRIKERKVYDLAASGEVPCSKAMGKLLFPRREIDAWLAANSTGLTGIAKARPAVFLGSHDPLLEWALRQSGAGLAMKFDSSLDGLERLSRAEGVAAGLHVFDPGTAAWNVPEVEARFAGQDVVMVEWAERRRGLIVAPGREAEFGDLGDIRGLRFVPRQEAAGSQQLFEHLRREAGLAETDIELCAPALSEGDTALAVLEGTADVAFGLEALAHQYRLAFVPLVNERFDLLVDRRAWFEPPMQTLMAFCDTTDFAQKAAAMPGYSVEGRGRIHFNA